jgi:hypothetical protein
MSLSKKASDISYALKAWKANHTYQAKEKFHRMGKSFLKEYAKQILNLESDAYDVRSSKGGDAVLGEVILHTDNMYIQLCEPYFDHTKNVLFRKCASRKDYCGGTNNWCDVMDLLHCSPLERLQATFLAY